MEDNLQTRFINDCHPDVYQNQQGGKCSQVINGLVSLDTESWSYTKLQMALFRSCLSILGMNSGF